MHTKLKGSRFNLQITDIRIQCKAVHHSVRYFSSASSLGKNDGKTLSQTRFYPSNLLQLTYGRGEFEERYFSISNT